MKTKLFLIALMVQTLAIGQGLDSLKLEAAHNNPGLKAAYKDFEAALQQVPQAAALADPVLSFGYFIRPVETRVGPQQAKFSLTQMFPWWGTLKGRKIEKALRAEASYQDFVHQRNALYHKVSEAYYELALNGELQRISQENIELLRTYKSLATTVFESGKGAMLDVVRVELRLAEVETRAKILKEEHHVLLANLSALLHRPLPVNFKIEAVDLPEGELLGEWDAAAHPQLKALDARVEAGAHKVALARKAGLPNLGLGLDYVMVGQRSDMDVADNGKDVVMPMLSLSLPIFRSKYKAARREAELQLERGELLRQEQENLLTNQHAQVNFQMAKARDFVELYTRMIEENELARRLQYEAYSNTGSGLAEVLKLVQEGLNYQNRERAAKYELLKAHSAMQHLLWAN